MVTVNRQGSSSLFSRADAANDSKGLGVQTSRRLSGRLSLWGRYVCLWGRHQRALLQWQSSAKVSTLHLLGRWGRGCCNLPPVWEEGRDSVHPAWQEWGHAAGLSHLTLTGAQIMVLIIPVLHVYAVLFTG